MIQTDAFEINVPPERTVWGRAISSKSIAPDGAQDGMHSAMLRRGLIRQRFEVRCSPAYGGRCAISHLPEPRLLDAAHIIMDADEELGQPIVANGLPLTKLHHAAFDAQLIGIDPDFRIHVSERLLEIHEGRSLNSG